MLILKSLHILFAYNILIMMVALIMRAIGTSIVIVALISTGIHIMILFPIVIMTCISASVHIMVLSVIVIMVCISTSIHIVVLCVVMIVAYIHAGIGIMVISSMSCACAIVMGTVMFNS